MTVGAPPAARHAVVVTVVHTPLDARIHGREIRALLDAGWRVTHVAPWSGYGIDARAGADLADATPGTYRAVDVPRARGRRRLGALRAARAQLRRLAPTADIIVLHDPELLVAALGVPGPIVWDVHEDTAAALVDKPWLPTILRAPVRALVGLAERWAERRHHLVLAEEDYRRRFRREHPVVPNHPIVPAAVRPPGDGRVVYLGRISRGRGIDTILAAAAELAGEVQVHLIGQADDDVVARLRAAERAGTVRWDGFVPNDDALRRIEGAAGGLSLLRDEPNYRSSLPTKVVEYLSRGVPAISTPLPRAVELIERHGGGLLVPFDDPAAVVKAVRRLVRDDAERRRLAEAGHAAARESFDWRRTGRAFVSHLERWTAKPRRR